jgi:catechol 2,3-dioxygenase-like lactoylglutathione lyase family enzyme
MFKRLAHVCLITDRTLEMIAFYRDFLGFPIKFTMAHDDGTDFGWYFGTGEMTFLELFDQKGMVKQWGGTVGDLKSTGGTHYGHFCLQTENIEDVRNKLVAKGLEVTPTKVGIDNSVQCWIKDPDGNRIELMEYTPTSKQL